MTFDLTWIDDPYAEDRERALDALPPSAQPAEFYAAAETGGSYFNITHAGMASLRSEMRRQGMLSRELEWKLSLNQGDVVTCEEIRAVLAVASETPAAPDREPHASWPSARWVARWQEWLRFLRGSGRPWRF